MKTISFDTSRFTVGSSTVEHQDMMQLILHQGWVTQTNKRWLGMWGKLIKESGICHYDLERTIRYSLTLKDKFNPRGFVRNRLQNRDWHKFDLPK